MSATADAHDPSVGVGRRRLPSCAGEEVTTPYRNGRSKASESTRR